MSVADGVDAWSTLGSDFEDDPPLYAQWLNRPLSGVAIGGLPNIMEADGAPGLIKQEKGHRQYDARHDDIQVLSVNAESQRGSSPRIGSLQGIYLPSHPLPPQTPQMNAPSPSQPVMPVPVVRSATRSLASTNPDEEAERASKRLNRQRRKLYLEDLERRASHASDESSKLKGKVSTLQAENRLLKDQLTFLQNMVKQAKTMSVLFKAGDDDSSVDGSEPGSARQGFSMSVRSSIGLSVMRKATDRPQTAPAKMGGWSISRYRIGELG